MSDINKRYNNIKNRVNFIEGTYRNRIDRLNEIESDIDNIQRESDILHKTDKVLKHLVDQMSKKDLQELDKIVTWGLNTVFPGRDIKFETEIVEKNNKLKINLKTIYNGEYVDPSNKSSITVVESFLLRVMCITKLHKAPVLLMDETFAAVGSEYIENISKLISNLSDKLGMDILLVTHNPAFQAYSKKSFKLTSNEEEVKIERVQ